MEHSDLALFPYQHTGHSRHVNGLSALEQEGTTSTSISSTRPSTRRDMFRVGKWITYDDPEWCLVAAQFNLSAPFFYLFPTTWLLVAPRVLNFDPQILVLFLLTSWTPR